MKHKHTHRGHCQACGRLHAATYHGTSMSDKVEVLLAKHGYNVTHGYFVGICTGSDRKPLELSHEHTDAVINSCLLTAKNADQRIAELRDGSYVPPRVRTGEKWIGGKFVEQWVTWAEATEYKRYEQIDREVYAEQRRAKFMRDHATFLAGLKASIHGRPLVPVEHRAPTPVKVGLQYKGSGGKQYEVVETNVHGGYGGRAIYTKVKQLDNGRVWRVTTASVRTYLQREGK